MPHNRTAPLKTRRLMIKVTPEEARRLRVAAKKLRLSMSELVRSFLKRLPKVA